MQQNYGKIQAANAKLIAISSDDVNATQTTVENKGLIYPVLADSNKDVINAYNVLDQSDTTIARPASYIISPDGTVAWKSIDTAAVRVPTATILTELGKL